MSDLVRDPLAYYGIRLITHLFTRNEMTRFDGAAFGKEGFDD